MPCKRVSPCTMHAMHALPKSRILPNKKKFSAIFHLLHFCHNKISTILIFQLLWRAALYKGCCSNVLFFTRNIRLDWRVCKILVKAPFFPHLWVSPNNNAPWSQVGREKEKGTDYHLCSSFHLNNNKRSTIFTEISSCAWNLQTSTKGFISFSFTTSQVPL